MIFYVPVEMGDDTCMRHEAGPEPKCEDLYKVYKGRLSSSEDYNAQGHSLLSPPLSASENMTLLSRMYSVTKTELKIEKSEYNTMFIKEIQSVIRDLSSKKKNK